MAILNKNGQEIKPFIATHVGKIIEIWMEDKTINQTMLSVLTDIPKSVISEIINGKRGLSVENAYLIGCVLDLSAEFLLNVQTKYILDTQDFSKRAAAQTEVINKWKSERFMANVQPI